MASSVSPQQLKLAKYFSIYQFLQIITSPVPIAGSAPVSGARPRAAPPTRAVAGDGASPAPPGTRTWHTQTIGNLYSYWPLDLSQTINNIMNE